MLRTCNVLRIAYLPVLRKDGARRRDVGLDEGTGLGLLRAARNDGAPRTAHLAPCAARYGGGRV
ncbi:MAG: hypothetical protein LBM98_13565 [Oscillospiraceae bacterium]|nr:hypothetical protein [Oscillospiraceae bacterium]